MSKQTQETLDSLNTLREQADETPDTDAEASESSSDDRSSSRQGHGRKENESSGDAPSKRSERSEQESSPVDGKSEGEDDGSAQSQARSNDKPSGLLDEVMGAGPSKRPPKESITFSLPHALTERLRNMCYYERLTMSQVVKKAIRYAVEEVEERHNDGEPYPDRSGDLPTSRPKR
jgi:hypothetical protein